MVASEVDVNRVLALGLVALLAPLGAACGEDGDDAPSAGSDAGPSEVPGSSVELGAKDIDFSTDTLQAAAGDITIEMTNEGQIEHTLVVEGYEADLKLVTPTNGVTDSGTINLPSGTYAYYCDVAGHRSAGMEGTLTVG